MPRIRGASLAEHRAATREQVFTALVQLLDERGFAALTMADLAEASGVGRTSLYNHFRDLEAVVVAFASEETDRYLAALKAVLDEADSPAQQLEAYVRQHVVAASEFHLGFGSELAAVLSPEAMRELREHIVAVEAVLREILAAGIAGGEFAVPDLDAAVSLIHATLNARHASADAAAAFVRAAVSAGGRAVTS